MSTAGLERRKRDKDHCDVGVFVDEIPYITHFCFQLRGPYFTYSSHGGTAELVGFIVAREKEFAEDEQGSLWRSLASRQYKRASNRNVVSGNVMGLVGVCLLLFFANFIGIPSTMYSKVVYIRCII